MSVTLPPWQNVVEPLVTLIVGLGIALTMTVIGTEAALEQLFASVTVTV